MVEIKNTFKDHCTSFPRSGIFIVPPSNPTNNTCDTLKKQGRFRLTNRTKIREGIYYTAKDLVVKECRLVLNFQSTR